MLVALFRGRRTPAADRLRAVVREGQAFAIPFVCFQEVLQGAKDEAEWRRLKATLETQELVGPEDAAQAHLEAARIFFDCRRKGLTVRSSVDCLIAQLALERGDLLLHDDDDFEAIAKVRPLNTLRR